MEKIILFFKGFLFGTANIIPGVSGGTMAITLGVYEKFLNVFGYFFKDVKENLKFIVPFASGIIVAIFVMSNVISYALLNYKMVTSMLFIGLIIGGLPPLFKRINKNKNKVNFLYFIAGFSVIAFLSLFSGDIGNNIVDLSSTSFIILFIVGIIVSSAMVIPGISGSFLLILLGFYEPILNVVKDLLTFSDFIFNASILFFFGLGILVGIVYISRLIKYLINQHEIKTYYTVIGFVIASIISIIINIDFASSEILYSIISLIIGLSISLKLGE